MAMTNAEIRMTNEIPMTNDEAIPKHQSDSDGEFMSVMIRMKKMGRKHRPFFRICATDRATRATAA